MADSLGGVGASFFAGTAWHYARYRPGNPQSFFDDIRRRLRLDGSVDCSTWDAAQVN
ncbi:hypothetical protein IU450_12465 [Nocardia abscessus]|uniref:hypothetical protein n=1 Tax=Nocardia abscessus TaxID=120957 RepID=UPI001894BDFB|nr:hypothetical protein [Nocardia abscessus]MBF6336696.1 hypothetical protein [Nocardia abscessus]